MKQVIVNTDCRSEEGITVGLVDGLISICRVLSGRDLDEVFVKCALWDLIEDEDFNLIISKAKLAQEEFKC